MTWRIWEGFPAPVIPDATIRQAALELNAAEPVRSAIPAYEAFTLCAALQLAWRHPGLPEAQRAIVEKAARDLQLAIGQRSAAAGELLELGWNRALDVQNCETKGCLEAAASAVSWPGQRRLRMCPPCTRRARAVADALGFEPYIEEIR